MSLFTFYSRLIWEANTMLIMGSFMLKNIHLHHLLMLMSFNKAITLKHIKWWHILKVNKKKSRLKRLLQDLKGFQSDKLHNKWQNKGWMTAWRLPYYDYNSLLSDICLKYIWLTTAWWLPIDNLKLPHKSSAWWRPKDWKIIEPFKL